MTPDAVAWACARAMYDRDPASRHLGMTIEAMAPGRARLAMRVTEIMSNGHGTAHGGMIFALADSAFAFACNSRDIAAVGQTCTITYLTPARLNETLTATATEIALVGRNGIYDVVVTGEDGRIVATFRGQSAALKTRVINEDPQ
ncbi:hydroxyphenylacetyl-CoA thioesterase PaaI [Zavarzinia aquatilis]|nr:hydroxyphenylacetyl-CoA thioesterase PaaI [Zavarzinia aquatilis]